MDSLAAQSAELAWMGINQSVQWSIAALNKDLSVAELKVALAARDPQQAAQHRIIYRDNYYHEVSQDYIHVRLGLEST